MRDDGNVMCNAFKNHYLYFKNEALLYLFIYRSLRCHRTRIHLHLFVAIIVQTIIRLMLYVDQYVARTRGGEIGGTSMGNSETIFDTVSFLFKHIA